MSSSCTRERSPCMSHLKPSSQPSTRSPQFRASMVAAAMTALMPGAGPPPTRMASVFMGYRSDGLLRTLRVWPVQVEKLPARRVHALVRVRAKVIALRLDEVGGEPRRSVAVEVGQRAPECGHRDAVPHRERHDLAPGFLARGEGPLEVG